MLDSTAHTFLKGNVSIFLPFAYLSISLFDPILSLYSNLSAYSSAVHLDMKKKWKKETTLATKQLLPVDRCFCLLSLRLCEDRSILLLVCYRKIDPLNRQEECYRAISIELQISRSATTTTLLLSHTRTRILLPRLPLGRSGSIESLGGQVLLVCSGVYLSKPIHSFLLLYGYSLPLLVFKAF